MGTKRIFQMCLCRAIFRDVLAIFVAKFWQYFLDHTLFFCHDCIVHELPFEIRSKKVNVLNSNDVKKESCAKKRGPKVTNRRPLNVIVVPL